MAMATKGKLATVAVYFPRIFLTLALLALLSAWVTPFNGQTVNGNESATSLQRRDGAGTAWHRVVSRRFLA